MKPKIKAVQPRPDWAHVYNDYYPKWLKLRETLSTVSQDVL
jgi:hypothetical protein